MPELPDLLYIVSRLRERLLERSVHAQRLREPVLLRCLVRGNLSLLLGRRLLEVVRKSHFVILRFEGFDLLVNPMLAGRFRLATPGEMDERALGFALDFGEVELRYVDDKAMGKAYLVAGGDWSAVPAFPQSGLDVLGPAFTRERFVSLLKHRRDQVRAFLMDKRVLDSIGNAYADEILFEAGLHPKTWCRSLSHADALRLHDAIVGVLRGAAEEVARRQGPLEVKQRDFLKVRLRDACPRCGTKIRKAGVNSSDAYFCPKCQPATRPGLVDWTKTGK